MQKRNAETSKAKIVNTAMLLFSKKGFDATTVDDIAKESGMNKALIYYYYKNKSGLYSTVMSNLFDNMNEAILVADKCCSTPVAELEAFIKTYAEYAQKHPYFPSLLLRELSDSGAHLPEMMFASMRKLFALLSDILRRGEKAGMFHNVIPMLIHFMIIGTLNLMITTQPMRTKAEVSEEVDTCPECSMDEIAAYIFAKTKLMLEVKE